jgi:hypothetical protein
MRGTVRERGHTVSTFYTYITVKCADILNNTTSYERHAIGSHAWSGFNPSNIGNHNCREAANSVEDCASCGLVRGC